MATLLEVFDPIPSWQLSPQVRVSAPPAKGAALRDVDALGVPVGVSGAVPAMVGHARMS